LKAQEWRSETFPRAKVTMEIESHCHSDYFDTYEDFPVETGEYFFDAEEEIDLDPVTDLCDVRSHSHDSSFMHSDVSLFLVTQL
jgi:hypothetical protein